MVIYPQSPKHIQRIAVYFNDKEDLVEVQKKIKFVKYAHKNNSRLKIEKSGTFKVVKHYP